jgi:hypothetical protein
MRADTCQLLCFNGNCAVRYAHREIVVADAPSLSFRILLFFFSSKGFCCENLENLSPVFALALFFVSKRTMLHLASL